MKKVRATLYPMQKINGSTRMRMGEVYSFGLVKAAIYFDHPMVDMDGFQYWESPRKGRYA